MVAIADHEIQAFMDTTSDLNLIQKDITVYRRLEIFFLAKADTKAGGLLFKTYRGFCKRIQIIDSFGALFKVRVSLTFANIEMPLILRLFWL